VFKLDTSGNETVLYSFTNSGGDGGYPAAGLVMDKAGNLYGTTLRGGTYDYGTVFELDASGNETVLHSFTNSAGDGALPHAGLLIDKKGNLYGTTEAGGTYGHGTVFEMDSSGNETVLYSFTKSGGDGGSPAAGLVMDKAGNLYGTTSFGGLTSNSGTVFKLDTSGNETVLHSFTNGDDGAIPLADLIIDKKGNLYGITIFGGAYRYSDPAGVGFGTVFKLVP
jgi:uncharacterized repeat protein (TIGR03803 family)